MKSILLILCLLGLAITYSFSQRKEIPGPGSAHVWYLGHCGFAVRTTNHLLIFDYQEFRDGQQTKSRPANPSLQNGWINPDEIKNLPVLVFASHSHSDHFDPVVFKWKEKIPDIQYFFGWRAAEDTSYHYLTGSRSVYKLGELEIATINSHHSGVPEVAWLVKADGLVIYHNGDCQPNDAKSEYEFLSKYAEHIDIAFVPPTTEDNLKYTMQNNELFERFSPGMVFPMHAAAGAQMYRDFEKVWKTKMPKLNVVVPVNMGEAFVYIQNKSVK
jgi:L-ascorbate metabolism protein UlaG (beta-lactamase superfamily)